MIGAARAARLYLRAAIRAVMTVVVVRRGVGAAVGIVRRGLRRDRLMHCAPTIDSPLRLAAARSARATRRMLLLLSLQLPGQLLCLVCLLLSLSASLPSRYLLIVSV